MAARRKLERVREVFDWAVEDLGFRREIVLELRPIPKQKHHELHGYVQASPGRARIVLDSRAPRWAMIETLLHELAHLKSGTWSDDPHHPRFYEWQSEIERRFEAWVKRTRRRTSASGNG